VASLRKRKKNRREVLGKTNMDEFGMGSHSTHSFFGPVLAPSPLRKHSVGGSSGGSAVAVATGQVRNALGTDTGGSVRLPAAYTGIVGFKPSYGLISRWGVVPYANSLDTVGILGASISTLWSGLAAGAVFHDPRDPTSITRKTWERMKERRKMLAIEAGRVEPEKSRHDLARFHLRHNFSQLKIGIPLEYNIEELEPAVREEWQNALKLFQEQGCTLVPISLPNTKHALSAYYVIAAAEAASNLSKYDGVRYGTRANSSDGAGDVLYSKTRGEGFGDEVKRRILLGSYSLSSKAINNYFIKAQKVRRLVQQDFDRVFSIPNLLRPEEQFCLSDMDESVQMDSKLGPSQVDFIVCPTAPTRPPTRKAVTKQLPVDSYMNDVFTVPSSLAGLPAVNLPFKLPNKPGFVGIQIIGQYSDDFRLLITARAVELLQKEGRQVTKQRFLGNVPITKHPSPSLVRAHSSEKGIGPDSIASKAPRGIKYPYENRKQLLRKVLSGNGDDRFRSPPKAKIITDEGESITVAKHATEKGDNRYRQPRTDKEITRSIEEIFEDWDNMVSGKR
jgi:aspartyl-tRNA(Asn)/glutamyl-tRNA(Gln) amidotransferase subunit A